MPTTPYPLTEIEAQLAQPGGAQRLEALKRSMAEQALALRQQMASGTLDREQFARVQAYAGAFDAASHFLGAVSVRSIESPRP